MVPSSELHSPPSLRPWSTSLPTAAPQARVFPLSTIGAYAHKIGAAPYYVAIDLTPGLLKRTEPILSIDYTHYGTKWHDSFYKAFVKDLTGRSTDEEHFNLVLFEKGRIVSIFTTEKLLLQP